MFNLPSRLHVEEGNFKPFSSASTFVSKKVGLWVDPFLGVWPGKDFCGPVFVEVSIC